MDNTEYFKHCPQSPSRETVKEELTVRLLSDGTVLFESCAKELDTVQTAHLFDRFFTVSTARDGTGLGLSIAKLLTERMNGHLTAEYQKGKLSIYVLFSDF